jgi:hypothetical protein
MSKAAAIKKFCRECAGGTWKDTVLCTGLDCPLWPYRLGIGIKSKDYKSLIAGIEKRWPEDVAGLWEYGLTSESFSNPQTVKRPPEILESTISEGVEDDMGEKPKPVLRPNTARKRVRRKP